MAYIAANTTSVAASKGRVAEFFADIRQSFKDYRLYRATFNELNLLQDRDLADLGIYRGDIAAIAREAVYGK